MVEGSGKSKALDFLSSLTVLKTSIINKTLVVEINRPKQLNAMNEAVFEELGLLFGSVESVLISELDLRVIVLTGCGSNFTAGLDLKSEIIEQIFSKSGDTGRNGFKIYNLIKKLQSNLSAIENNPLPVICAIQGYCLGGGTSIITCGDIRLCTKDAKFSIKEVDIGLTADIGVLQRITKQTGNEGYIKLVSLTGEIFTGEKAKELGLVQGVYESGEQLMKEAMKLADKISEKSPIVIWGIKKTLNFARDNKVETSLDMIRLLNSALIQTEDIPIAVTAVLQKQKPIFPKF